MKILQVNKLYFPWIGGVETAVQDIAEHFHGRDGWIVQNLACVPKGSRLEDSVNGVPICRAGSSGMALGMPLSIDFFVQFRKRVQDADLVFLHHPFPLAFMAYWIFGRKKRVVVWYHSDIVRQKTLAKIFNPFLFFTLRRAGHIFVSNRTLVGTSKILQRFSEKCRVIYFGVDAEKFAETESVKRRADEIKRRFGTPLLLSVGRLVYYKGFSYLIDAMKGVDANLLIVGDGVLKSELLEKIEKEGLSARITIIDPVDDLVAYYHACDVFVLPSCEPSEVFGIVQIEAMACGKPVVNTALPTGVPEVSESGKTGITVPPKNSEALRSAIKRLVEDESLRILYGHAAKRLVSERYTKKTFFEKLEMFLGKN